MMPHQALAFLKANIQRKNHTHEGEMQQAPLVGQT
jgi:hypothetical protein